MPGLFRKGKYIEKESIFGKSREVATEFARTSQSPNRLIRISINFSHKDFQTLNVK
jgi:hypothetical protein